MKRGGRVNGRQVWAERDGWKAGSKLEGSQTGGVPAGWAGRAESLFAVFGHPSFVFGRFLPFVFRLFVFSLVLLFFVFCFSVLLYESPRRKPG